MTAGSSVRRTPRLEVWSPRRLRSSMQTARTPVVPRRRKKNFSTLPSMRRVATSVRSCTCIRRTRSRMRVCAIWMRATRSADYADTVMRLGSVAVVPYVRPGDPRLGELVGEAAHRHHAILLANHGPVVAATSLEPRSPPLKSRGECQVVLLAAWTQDAISDRRTG